MPPSSWCNWWKCAENQVSVAARVSAFVSVILTLQYWVSSVCSYITLPSLWPCSRPYWVVSCERWAAVWSSSCVHYKFFYAFTCIPLSLYVCVLSRIKKKLAACLLFFIRMVRNVLGSLLYTQTVWPHVRKRRQHSSCYRYASVRVVMVAAQPEISSCYLRSAENLINTTKLTRPNLNDLQATHEGIALLHVCICL